MRSCCLDALEFHLPNSTQQRITINYFHTFELTTSLALIYNNTFSKFASSSSNVSLHGTSQFSRPVFPLTSREPTQPHHKPAHVNHVLPKFVPTTIHFRASQFSQIHIGHETISTRFTRTRRRTPIISFRSTHPPAPSSSHNNVNITITQNLDLLLISSLYFQKRLPIPHLFVSTMLVSKMFYPTTPKFGITYASRFCEIHICTLHAKSTST